MVIMRTLAFIAATILSLAACSGRSSKPRLVDAGVDSGIDAEVDGKPIDFFAYLPTSDAAPALACMGCFKSQCGNEMNACANSVNCREGLLCAFGQCSAWSGALNGSVSSGISSADLTCISTCFKGDLSAALLAGKSASCATTTCRDACESVLPIDGGGDAVMRADGPSPAGLDGSGSVDAIKPDSPSFDVPMPGTVDAPSVTDTPSVTTFDGAIDTGL